MVDFTEFPIATVSGDALISELSTGRTLLDTWPALAAIAGTIPGQGAEVIDTDTGTHTDPVTGLTVPNSGRFTWSESPAGWKRIGDTGLSAKLNTATFEATVSQRADLDEVSIALTDANGAGTWLQATAGNGGPTAYAAALMADNIGGFPAYVDVDGVSLALAVGDHRTWLEVSLLDGGPTALARAMLTQALQMPNRLYDVAAYGDSMTQGAYGGGLTFPEMLAAETGLVIENAGLSGSTSAEIAIRAGGNVPLLSFTGGVIPAATTPAVVTVNLAGPWSSTDSADRVYSGSVRGITGLLTYDCSAGTWAFARAVAGAEIALPERAPFVVADPLGLHLRRQIFWAGRNDAPKADAAPNIMRQIDRFRSLDLQFVVISCFNTASETAGSTGYDAVIALNHAIQDYAPREFVDLRGRLIREGLVIAGITPTAQDMTDIANDNIPSSLSFDGTHTNASGRYAEAVIIADELRKRGWI